MAKGLFVARGGTLVPADTVAIKAVGRLDDGQRVVLDVKRQRNPDYHRRAMKLLTNLFDMQDRYATFDAFRYWITCKAGYVEFQIIDAGFTEPKWAALYDELPAFLAKIISFGVWIKIGQFMCPLLPQEVMIKAESLSYESMDEDRFRSWFNDTVQTFIDNFGPLITVEQMEEVIRY